MNEQNKPLYMKIYDSLVDKINRGEIHAGDRIYTEKELAEKFDVSRITSRKALEMMAENGYIKRIPGKGSFITFRDGDAEEGQGSGVKRVTMDKPAIGFILPDFSSSYGVDLISGAERETVSNGRYFMFYRTYGSQEIEEKAIESFLEIGVEGIILMPVHGENYNPKIFKMVLDGIPFVMIDRNLKGIPAPFVGTDNVAASKKLTDYLLDEGYKSVAFISTPETGATTIEERLEGFTKSHLEHGMVINPNLLLTNLSCTIPGKNTEQNIKSDIEKVRQLILNQPSIDCLFAVEYNLSLVAMEAVKSLSLNVPEDISVVCFDGPQNYIGEYYLTHIRQKETQMGAEAVRMLLRQQEGDERNKKVYLEADLVIGKSTRHK